MSVSSSQVHYAQIGSCQNVVSGKTRCAISPDDCEPARNEDGEKWYSAIRMEEKVKSGSGSSAAACRCEDTLIGACVFVGGKQMTYECAPRTTRSVNSVSSSSSSSTATSSSDEEQDNDDIDDADYCRPEEDDAGNILDPSYEFLPANAAGTNCFCDALHSIEDDSVTGRSSSRTRYGACYIPPNKNNKNDDDTEDNKFFCAYSSEYCTGDHVWIHPNDVPTIRGDNGSEGGAKGTGTTNYCHCETTRIGGCVGGFHDFHCGISDSDCWNTMFVPPIPLKVEHNHACLLCQQIMTIHPEQDEIDTMEFQHQDTTTTTTASSNSSTSNSNIAKAGVGVLLLLVTLTALIAMTCIFIRKKKNRQQKSSNEDNDDDDDNDNDDDDNKKKNDENDTDNNDCDIAPVVDMPSPSSLSNVEEDDCIIPEIS